MVDVELVVESQNIEEELKKKEKLNAFYPF